MTDAQVKELKKELGEIKRRIHNLETEVEKIVAKVPKYDEAYGDYIQGKKWILRLGIATLLSAALSPHLASITTWVKGFIK